MKYVMKFSKTGRMIYISHLDLTRMLIRALRASGLRPAYSHGFNPHPKVGMALPLALGQYSEYELLEFETEKGVDLAGAKPALAKALPEGIHVKELLEKPFQAKASLASYVSEAVYEIHISGMDEPEPRLTAFLAQAEIVIDKIGKKERRKGERARPSQIDVRDRIGCCEVKRAFENEILFEVSLAAASGRMLSPGDFLKALFEFAGCSADDVSFTVTRTAILGENHQALI